MSNHVSNNPLLGSIESSLKHGKTNGHFADTDLTSSAATLAAIETNKANLHVSQRNLPINTAKAVEIGVDLLGETVFEGEDIADITSEISGEWREGFPVSL